MATVRELAALVGGELCGDGGRVVTAARPFAEAGETDITFLDFSQPAPETSKAAAIVVPPGVTIAGPALIHTADPFAAFVSIASHLDGRTEPWPLGIDPLAEVNPTAVIGGGATIEAFAVVRAGAVIGARCRVHSGAIVGRDCKLGDDVTLHPHVVLYDRTVLGDRVTVHANSVIGADGFGYRFQEGRHVKVPQLGWVEVGDDVEIGACTTIDRGTFGATRIGAGTKIDNLVMIAHNCQVGRHNVFVSQMGMAGSSQTGDYVVIAGQVGVVDHVRIGDGCTIGGQAAVTKDVAPGQRMLGSPATPEREQKRILMSLAGLPELRRDVLRILRHLGMQDEGQEAA
ncbi:MAG TPA: UDP-3-O-(3-hydroxymyristoyl)glucosamine N-acyltransferase [Gemmataceae bacterium]|jgi:UDP-3-O-[3-hydroxymyristoyl] glucosamine N-acyltransferase|nr:UDP-3-O-(3-hydroxymyristoyl)glucosamine N-acyltransferase [Gemmataceae bacterium]